MPSPTLAQLRCAPTFEAGARWVLDALLSATEASPDEWPSPLRAMLYLRPGGTWQTLAILDRAEEEASIDIIASASVWTLLQEQRRPLALSIRDGTVRGFGGGDRPTPLPASRTLAGLRRRRTLALLALPLLGVGDEIVGAAVLEFPQPLPSTAAELAHALLPIADAAALILPALPSEPPREPAEDALLPVVGAVMARRLALLEIFAQQDETLLLNGPTGVGKSRLALRCHQRSPAAAGPFEVAILSTVPPDMQLPALFGWRRGAFTGANSDHAGAVARAERGTLFLDEIDKLSLAAQAGLLQFLEERTWRPLGDTGPLREAHVRVIVATNANLRQAVDEGRFLEDLLFRVQVFPVDVPGLDERRDEIPAWTKLMLTRRHQSVGGQGEVALGAGVSAMLAAQDWPGNLRQLDSVVRRAYAVALVEGPVVRIEVRHIEEALELGGARSAAQPATARREVSATEGAPTSTLSAMNAAADALVAEARARGGLPFEILDAFTPMVLQRAAGESGDLRAAYELFDRHALVESRSFHRDFRRRVERLHALHEALGEPPPRPGLSRARSV